MAVNESLSAYSTTAASNTPAGTDTVGPDLDNHLRDIKAKIRKAAELSQGASQPGGFKGQMHLSTSASPTYTVKIYDGTDWLPLIDLDTSANTTTVYDGASTHTFASTDAANTFSAPQTFSSGTATFSVPLAANDTLDVSGTTTLAGIANTQALNASATATFIDVAVNALWTDGATGGDQGADTINASALYDDGTQIHALADGVQTEVATTSGTTHDFTGIRSDAHRITVYLDGVSTNGSSDIIVQIGDSGGIETSGYEGGTAQQNNNTNTFNNWSNGINIRGGSIAAGNAIDSKIVLERANGSNKWACDLQGNLQSAGSNVNNGFGFKSLSGTLDRVRLTTDNGTDVFDAGTMNIRVE